MAEFKKGLGLKTTTNISTLELAKKKDLKSSVINNEMVDKTVQQIHSIKMTRLSLDVSPELYDAIKRKQLDKKFKTTRDYILSLIEKDLL